MTIDITWEITGLESCPDTGTVQKVVYEVTATDGITTETLSAVEELAAPGGGMVPFSELTRELVLEWVHNLIGPDSKAAIEDNQRGLVEGTVVPPPVSTELPPLF